MVHIPEEAKKGMFAGEVLTAKQKQTIVNLLNSANICPTRPHLIVAHYLFSEGHKGVTPDALYSELAEQHLFISLATVYNCLIFCERQIAEEI